MAAGLRVVGLADVHGNLPALEAVLADMWREGAPDGIIVAGDHVVGAPYPAETLRLLESLGCAMSAGNRDGCLTGIHRGQRKGWETGEASGSVRWGYRSLDAEQLECLALLPEQTVIEADGAVPIRVIHGSLDSISGRIYPSRSPAAMERFWRVHVLSAPHEQTADAALDRILEPVLVCGHTHLQWAQHSGGRPVLNPGSIGESLDSDNRARYAILTWDGLRWRSQLRAVSYDVEPVRRAFHDRGLLAEGGGFARASLRNIETGRNLSGYFVKRAEDLARESGLPAGVSIPDEIWQGATATFDLENGAP